ncbi:MAG: hypothetical protein AB8B83_02040 [Bdellovibrionales bacterium]
MKRQKRYFHSMIATISVLVAFACYYTLTNVSERNQAYAAISSDYQRGEMVNYKPALKRHLSAQLRQNNDQILSLSGHDVFQIFDRPELVRKDLPTTVWQYRNELCVMDVYFTVDRAEDVARTNVAHYELRARNSREREGVKLNECMQGLVANDTMISLIDINSIFKAGSKSQ